MSSVASSLLDKPIWTVEELAEFLSIKTNTIYRQIYNSKNGLGRYTLPPYFRLGGQVSPIRYYRDDVLRWIDEKRNGGNGG